MKVLIISRSTISEKLVNEINSFENDKKLLKAFIRKLISPF